MLTAPSSGEERAVQECIQQSTEHERICGIELRVRKCPSFLGERSTVHGCHEGPRKRSRKAHQLINTHPVQQKENKSSHLRPESSGNTSSFSTLLFYLKQEAIRNKCIATSNKCLTNVETRSFISPGAPVRARDHQRPEQRFTGRPGAPAVHSASRRPGVAPLGLLDELVHPGVRSLELPPAMHVHGVLQLFRERTHLRRNPWEPQRQGPSAPTNLPVTAGLLGKVAASFLPGSRGTKEKIHIMVSDGLKC